MAHLAVRQPVDVDARRLLQIHQEQAAAVDRRLAAIERDQDILHSRVQALELHVFNRAYPRPQEEISRATRNVADRLANRVAAIERAAVMTIPVGVTVGYLPAAGPLHGVTVNVVNPGGPGGHIAE